MNEVAPLFDLAGVVVLLSGLVFAIRRLAGDEPINLADLFAHPKQLPWPHGVQEDEPIQFHVEALCTSALSGSHHSARLGQRDPGCAEVTLTPAPTA